MVLGIALVRDVVVPVVVDAEREIVVVKVDVIDHESIGAAVCSVEIDRCRVRPRSGVVGAVAAVVPGELQVFDTEVADLFRGDGEHADVLVECSVGVGVDPDIAGTGARRRPAEKLAVLSAADDDPVERVSGARRARAGGGVERPVRVGVAREDRGVGAVRLFVAVGIPRIDRAVHDGASKPPRICGRPVAGSVQVRAVPERDDASEETIELVAHTERALERSPLALRVDANLVPARPVALRARLFVGPRVNLARIGLRHVPDAGLRVTVDELLHAVSIHVGQGAVRKRGDGPAARRAGGCGGSARDGPDDLPVLGPAGTVGQLVGVSGDTLRVVSGIGAVVELPVPIGVEVDVTVGGRCC